MVFKMKMLNHLRILYFMLMGTVFMFIALYFLNFDSDFLKIFTIVWLIFFIPSLYLHIEYFLKNQGIEIEIEEKTITAIRKHESKSFNFSEIDKIILYKSASLDKGGIQLSPIESYYYTRIVFKSGEELIMTCLLIPDIEEVLNKLPRQLMQRKKRLFCTTFWR